MTDSPRYAVVTAGGKKHVGRWTEPQRCCSHHTQPGHWTTMCYQRAKDWEPVDGLADCARCIHAVNTDYAHHELDIAKRTVARLEEKVAFLLSLLDPQVELEQELSA